MGEIVAAGCSSHAPQLSKKEIKYSSIYAEQVKRIHDALKKLWEKMSENDPDSLIIIYPDHIETFFLTNFPSINVIVDRETEAHIPGWGTTKFEINYELAKDILFGLVENGFDPSFSQRVAIPHAAYVPLMYMFRKNKVPIVPIHVNANVDPKIHPKRALELGRTIAKIIAKKRPSNEKIAIIGTGGLSHYPGTPYYGKIDVETDNKILSLLKEGKGEELTHFTPEELEETGNIELRTWIVTAGSVGNRPAELIERQITYHIDYAVVRFLL
ncbi:hypothetical protein [Saccharolobus sp. E5-1-F]|uniref:DODA-type extradiol aromatic ring-opening family dioxygenase n=1 Tax=Saccharolobus sp. E5-1-F TaxID=2663019 RepID=UPI0013866FB9|nr:hypothetical protein [Sulfolobus sp. E5-1-F]